MTAEQIAWADSFIGTTVKIEVTGTTGNVIGWRPARSGTGVWLHITDDPRGPRSFVAYPNRLLS